MASAAVNAARGRRSSRTGVNIEWFINDVQKRTDLTVHQRVLIAMEYLRDKVVKNISIPVTKEVVNGITRVTERSKPGEFPRADTTLLRKTIVSDVVKTDKGFNGYIITPIDYGLTLEIEMDRSFLRRTLVEEMPVLERILGARIE